jgi:hypothetical protein
MDMKTAIHAGLAGLLTLPLLSGCGGDAGGGSPAELTDAGYASLGTSDWQGALTSFESALAGIEPGGEGFVRAAMGEIEALVHIDAEKAKDKFLALAQSYPDAIGTRQYKTVGGQLTSEKKFTEAIAVLDAGMKAHAEDPSLMALIDRVKEEAEKAGDSGALSALEGLGYL